MNIDTRWRKWLAMAAIGSLSGLLTLLLFRSIPVASGTAVLATIGLVAAKHLALAIAVGSPLAAFFRSVKPAIKARCPFSSSRGG